jgi:hypothetical protein
MPNARWNNMHGANDRSGGGHKEGSRGSKPGGSMPMKTANWPGLPGKTQPKARNAGIPKTGHKGSFRVKAVGV